MNSVFRRLPAAFALSSVCVFVSTDAGAQLPFEIVHHFGGGSAPLYPEDLLLASDGNFYGISQSGGQAGLGTFYKMTASGTLTVLHSFDGIDGVGPNGLIEGSDGNFYGTAYGGGASSHGTLFKITSAGTITVLHSFSGGAGGTLPGAGVVQGSDGYLYGTTINGGVTDRGIAFRASLDGGFTVLHSFAGGPVGDGDLADGAYPAGALIQASDGNLYGVTWSGGQYGFGCVYRLSTSGAFSLVHSFTGGSGGARPQAALLQASDGLLYGTTSAGGATVGPIVDQGLVFRMTLAGSFAILHNFVGTDGIGPTSDAPLIEAADGRLYGTTPRGGDLTSGSEGPGTVFRIETDLSFTSLYAFPYNGSAGAVPSAALVEGTDGDFYGTTRGGGSVAVAGTLFKINAAGTRTLVHGFMGDAQPSFPSGALVEGSDGALYGTSESGGVPSMGTVFKLPAVGEVSVVHTFNGTTDGGRPFDLARGEDGSFYGSTYYLPRIFRVTSTGDLTIAATYDTAPFEGPHNGKLLLASDGNLYGTTYHGGDSNKGTVFRLTTGGTVTILHSFSGIADGSLPAAALIEATDGALYGTTAVGGSFNKGTAFRITLAGTLTVLRHFNGRVFVDDWLPHYEGDPGDTAHPRGAFVQGADGALYGVGDGGASARGTIYRLALNGAYSLLHSFGDTAAGLSPSELIQALDGYLYGVTRSGGANNLGTIFRIGTSGGYEVLHSFSAGEGSPGSALMEATDGNLYGTTSSGGLYGHGVIFRIGFSSGCTYTLSNTTSNVRGAASVVAANLTTSPGCGWSVLSDAPWLTTNIASGSGANSIDVSVAANPTTAPRVGHLVVGRRVFTVNQSAGVALLISTGAPAPHPTGVPVTFTATATGATAPYEYKWWLFDGAWTVLADWGTSAECTWTPTAAREYRVGAWVRSAASGTDAPDGTASVDIEVPRIQTLGLTSDKTAPQVARTTIVFTATASDGTTPYQFKWFLFDGTSWTAKTAWVSSNTWSWTPGSGNTAYRVGVWARSGGASEDSAEAAASVPFPVQPAPRVSTVTITPNASSPQLTGTTVHFTATSSGGEGPYDYRWWTFDGATWQPSGGWVSGGSFDWTPGVPGNYRIGVWARSAGNPDDVAEAVASVQFAIERPHVTVLSISSDKTSPQVVETAVTFTAHPTGGEAPREFRWWVFDGASWSSAQAWGADTFIWTPHASGTFLVGVWARSGGSTSDAPEAVASVQYVVQVVPRVIAVSLGSDRPAPQPPGASVLFTATPTGGSAPRSYKWWHYDGAAWTELTGWTTNATYSWTPTTVDSASRIGVWVRSAGNAADSPESVASVAYPVAWPSLAITLSVDVGTCPTTSGSSVTVGAGAAGGSGSYQYRWWLFDGTSWAPQGTWTTEATLAWLPQGVYPGGRVGVWARDAANTADLAQGVASITCAVNAAPQ